MTEIKVKFAALAAAAAAWVAAQIAAWLGTRGVPLPESSEEWIASLLLAAATGGVSWLVGWWKRSRTSATSDGFNRETAARALKANGKLRTANALDSRIPSA